MMRNGLTPTPPAWAVVALSEAHDDITRAACPLSGG